MAFDQCLKCGLKNIYFDGELWNCLDCFHAWNAADAEKSTDDSIKDAYGTKLTDGDTVLLIKELKVKGSSSAIKIGTKVKNIKLGDFGAGHDISCKIDGFGAMNLKSEFVKKA